MGLRRAARYYSELVVPGIGGAWRVRHLSWSVAGIYLAQEAPQKASAATLAHAIEALGNKLQWATMTEEVSINRPGSIFGLNLDHDLHIQRCA